MSGRCKGGDGDGGDTNVHINVENNNVNNNDDSGSEEEVVEEVVEEEVVEEVVEDDDGPGQYQMGSQQPMPMGYGQPGMMQDPNMM